MLVAAHDAHVDELAHLQAGIAAILDLDHAVDLRRVGHRAGDRQLAIEQVDQATLHAADLGLQPRGGYFALALHEAGQPFLLHFLRHRVRQRIGRRAVHRRIGERADAIELRLVEEIEQLLELGLGLAGETDDEGRAQGQVRARCTPALHALQGAVDRAGPLHQLEDPRTGVLERDVQVRQHLALRHQRNHVIDVRVRVDVMQPRPRIQFGQAFAQRLHPGLVLAPAPAARGVLQVHAVGRGVLRDHQQFAHPALDQPLGLAQHLVHRARDQVTAQGGDDAEAAAMVAALGNLQVGVVVGRELDANVRHQVQEWIVLGRQGLVHRFHHAAVILRAGHRQHIRVMLADHLRLLAQAAGDDDLAVLVHRLADGIERFGHRRVDEAACVDHHHIGVVVAGHQVVAFHPQLGKDALGIDQGLGTAEADEAHLGVLQGHVRVRQWLPEGSGPAMPGRGL